MNKTTEQKQTERVDEIFAEAKQDLNRIGEAISTKIKEVKDAIKQLEGGKS